MIWFKRDKIGTVPLNISSPGRKPTYYTIVLDVEKYNRWLEARKENGADINHSKVAKAIGYNKSFLAQILNRQKYGLVEIGPRFIATFLATWGFWEEGFKELFQIIPVSAEDKNPQKRYPEYDKMTNYLRQDREKLPRTYWAR